MVTADIATLMGKNQGKVVVGRKCYWGRRVGYGVSRET
jgi:hypothetical protein